MAVRARILAVNQTGSAAMALLATSGPAYGPATGPARGATQPSHDMPTDSPSIVLARVLDHLAVVCQRARRAQLDIAAQLGDIANRFD